MQVTFQYGEKRYTLVPDAESSLKGNLSCDCKKALLIREYCDEDFPALKCGQSIALVSLGEETPELETVSV